jgi:diketogulonate reductase-like aldo/keto reductase
VLTAAAAVTLALPAVAQPLTKPIGKTTEALPLVGLGSWITFNVGDDAPARDACAAVMRAFFAAGGRMIDSSPMYGSSQEVIGYGIKRAGNARALFSATKVWISGGANGPPQMEESRRLWGVPRFDLMQVHNLLSWEEHLPTLFAMKAQGKLRYVGVTTSHGRRHDELERIMRSQPIDFIQVTYNVASREVEDRILPLAFERKIGVIVNRPFEQGDLIDATAGKPLPAFAAELGCKSWAQLLLKFIISHPAATYPIPATTRVDHVQENLAAATGPLPDPAMRKRILAAVGDL